MAYNTSPGRAEYVATAAQTNFPFSFKIFTETDIKVYQTPVGNAPNDTNDILTYITDYTVTINGDLGGEIVLVSGAPLGDAVTLVRSLPVERSIEYQTSGDLLASTLNMDLNFNTYLTADREQIGNRYVSIPESAQNVSTDLPDVSPDSYLVWNSAGDALVNDTTIPNSVGIVEGYKDDAEKFAYGDPVGSGTTTKGAQQYSEDASGFATDSSNSATSAQLKAWEAEAEKLTADSYATEAEDTPVNIVTSDGDGTFTYTPTSPAEYSSLHYSIKATSGGTERTSARNTAISASASGVLALATTPTASFATVTYTGNGTSQSIVTGLESSDPNWVSAGSYTIGDIIIHGYYIYTALTTHSGVATTPDVDTTNWSVVADGVSVPFLNSQVWVKGRSAVSNHQVHDTLRGAGKSISSDLTNAEVGVISTVTSFNNDGFSVGTVAAVNNNLDTFVAWQEQFDTMVSGTTNQGKRYITAYNAQSGKGMTIYVGSGTAGHEIPHGLGTKIDFNVVKSRDSILSWIAYNSINGATEYLLLDTNAASAAASNVWDDTEPTESVFTIGTNTSLNNLNENYVAYFSSNRDNHTVTKMYQGTGAAGNVVDLGLDMTQAGAKVMIKALSTTGNWGLFDNVRGDGATGAKYLSADTSTQEAEASTVQMEYTATGVIIGTSAGLLNTAGVTYLIEATVPNYDKPTGGLDIPAGTVISYAEGTDGTTGDLDSIETTTLTSDVTLSEGDNYIYIDKGNVKGVTDVKLLKGADRVSADKWGVVSPSDTTLKTTDKHSDYASATGVVSASSELSGTYPAYGAFNKVNLGASGSWLSASATGVGEEIIYSFSEPRIPKSAEYWNIVATDRGDITEGSYYGSNDNGVTWTLIKSFTGVATGSAASSGLLDLTNTTAYKKVKLVVDAVTFAGAANYVSIGELELNTEHPAGDFYDVAEGILYDSTDTAKSRVYLGEVIADGEGLVIPDTLVEYPVAHQDVTSMEVHEDLTVHGEMFGGQVCTGWGVVDGTTTPPTILDSYNIDDVVRTATGKFSVYPVTSFSDDEVCFTTTSQDSSSRSIGLGDEINLSNGSKINLVFSYDAAIDVNTLFRIVIFGRRA